MRLPEPDYYIDNEPPKDKAWEYEVLGFLIVCDISSSEEHPRIFTTRADFNSPETFSAPISAECGSSLIEFCLESECQQCEGSKIGHIVHTLCWKLINTPGKRHSTASIYEFSQSRYPLFDVGGGFDSEHNALMDLTNTTAERLDDTELGYLLRRFLRLPPEIRTIISAKLPSESSIVPSHSQQNIASGCRQVSLRSNFYRVQMRHHHNSLWAAQTSILGHQYISSVAFNKSEGILLRRADNASGLI